MALLLVLPLAPARAAEVATDTVAPAVTTEAVAAAVAKAVAWLRSQQQADGRWQYGGIYDIGATALVLQALLVAGVAKDDPAIAAGARFLVSHRPDEDMTYSVALTAIALAQLDAARHRAQIQRAAEWLVGAQLANGMWTYSISDDDGDASNTQIAVLGLREAERAGAAIPEKTWQRIDAYYVHAQNDDGGWGYSAYQRESYASMTAAGIASLLIVTGRSTVAQTCGDLRVDRRITAGIDRLAAMLESALTGIRDPDGYCWYAIERAALLARRQHFGRVDWYRMGCARLIASQGADGSWNDPAQTAFGVLFLAKGRKPLLVSKLAWDGDWNDNAEDVDGLVRRVGVETGTAYDWQVVQPTSELADLRRTPVLFLNGHTAPVLDAAAIARLRAYMDEGGTIVAEACCGSAAFDRGMRALAAELGEGATLAPLPDTHPVYGIHHRIPPAARFLEGLSRGCRVSLIYLPRGISCRWDGRCPGGDRGIDAETALQLGTNIVRFALGDAPAYDRLAVVATRDARPVAAGEVPGGLVWAQVQHGGDCNPDQAMWPHLADALRADLGVEVATQRRRLRLDDAVLRHHPLLYMEGHAAFALSGAEIAGLREHLANGGVLLAESCCGRPAFDAAFRAALASAFPDRPLEPLPADDPLLRGPRDARTVAYRNLASREHPDLDRPALEVLRLHGRIAVVYSPYGLGCAIDGHPCADCRSYAPESATAIVVDVVAHALAGTAGVGAMRTDPGGTR